MLIDNRYRIEETDDGKWLAQDIQRGFVVQQSLCSSLHRVLSRVIAWDLGGEHRFSRLFTDRARYLADEIDREVRTYEDENKVIL